MRDELIVNNLGLVYVILKQLNLYHMCDMYYDVGVIGLVKAANAYDPSKGYKFSAIASTCIRNEILYYIRRENMSCRKGYYSKVSLDAIIDSSDGNLTLIDLIPSDFDMEEHVILNEQKELLRKALLKLSKDEQKLLKLYYGRDNMSQIDIAKKLNTSQAQVSRQIKRIIEKLKNEINY